MTLEKLLEFIPDSNGEQQRLEGLMRKSRLSLAEAKEKYPDWYERRIVKKERRGRCAFWKKYARKQVCLLTE